MAAPREDDFCESEAFRAALSRYRSAPYGDYREVGAAVAAVLTFIREQIQSLTAERATWSLR